MNPVSTGEYHGLRVAAAVLCIVAGCIIIGVSRECDADAVGGIFLGVGGLGLLISVYPFIKAWLNLNNMMPMFGNRVRPQPTVPAPVPELPAEALRREGTQSQLNLERSKSRLGTFVEGGPAAEANPDEG